MARRVTSNLSGFRPFLTLWAEVHDRMPVLLEAKDFEQWERGDAKDAAALMKPADEDVLQRWPVSKRVNSSRAADDDPTLVEIEPSVATAEEILAAKILLCVSACKISTFLTVQFEFSDLRRVHCTLPSGGGCP
jgi:hypothetical protein